MNNTIRKLKQQQLYYQRKFYEISQDLLELSNTIAPIIQTASRISKALLQTSEEISNLTKKRSYSPKTDIINQVICRLNQGDSFSTPSLASEFNITAREASYIINKIYATKPYMLKTKINNTLSIKKTEG